MRSNLVLCAIIALCSVQVALGHTYFDSLVINGQTRRECIRPHRQFFKDDPIGKVSDADMTCGFLPDANRPAQAKCPIEAGSRLSLQWWHTQPGDDVVADTHKGPCMVYLAKSNTGSGPVWFKIFESGLDIATQTWCVDTLIRNRGKLDIQLPANLTAGDYLLRGEVIAMHNGYAVDGAQPYVHCAELTITGNGQDAPPASSLVSFPGAYKNTDPGLYPVSLYEGRINRYTIPGPPVWGKYSSNPSSGNSGGGGVTPPSTGSNGNNNGGSYTGSSDNNNGAIPTVSSSATCGAVTVTSAMRAGASWGNPINNIFDITVVNRGSSDIRDLVIKITLDSNTPAYRVTEHWNLVKTDNTYWFTEVVGAGKTYKGAGYIVAGGSASVQVLCPSSSSSGQQQPGYGYTSSSSSSSSSSAAAVASTSSSSSSTSSSSTTGTVVPPPPPPSGDNSCRAGISFTLSNSWNGGGMVSIVVSNTGSKPITSLKIRAEVDDNSWNLFTTATKRVYTVPAWTLPLAPGAKFDGAGYTFTGAQPAAGSIVEAICP